jgi:hypothetical protein
VERPVAAHATLRRPLVSRIAAARLGGGTGIVHRSEKALALDDHVENNFVVEPVQLFDLLRRLGEVPRMKRELPVARVPARGGELRSQIDESVARKFLLAERPRDAANLVRSCKRSMRLLVAEGPPGRHLRESGDARVFRQDDGRILGGDQKHVERRSFVVGVDLESPFLPGEVEGAERLMDVKTPSVRPDQPLYGYPPPVSPQAIPALAVSHRIDRPFAIELRAALPHPEERSLG